MQHERLLTTEEVTILLDFTLSSDRWNVLLGTGDDDFADSMRDILRERDDITLHREHSACDTLISCVRERPDLLVIDESLDDIDAARFIGCMKHRDGLDGIKIIRLSDGEVPGTIPADDEITKSPVDPSYITRRITSQLYSGYEISDAVSMGRGRRWPRTVLNLTATIEALDSDGKVTAAGDGVVENISRTGAAVSCFNLDAGAHPQESQKFRMRIDHSRLKDWSAEAVVVRLKPDESAGVRFVGMSKPDQIKICELFDE